MRRLLSGIEFKEQPPALIKMGDKAFPAYAVILADPKSKPQHISRAMGIIAIVPGDRSRFVEPAVQLLGHHDWLIRLSAAQLVGKIGNVRDVAPVVALLADEKWEVSFAAAKTLAAIGDRRTLTALDVWLNSGKNRDDAELRKHVAKYRDELKQRLAEKKKAVSDTPPKP